MQQNQILAELQRIRSFQINDLRKADEKGANFLVCVGCLSAAELLGGISTELLGQEFHVSERLKSGFRFLGGVYETYSEELVQLRNSLVHSYLGKTKKYANVDITNQDDPNAHLVPIDLGIQFINGRFVVNVNKWISDLEEAWGKLVQELQADEAKMNRLGVTLDDLPRLR